jgi:Putative beta-barrel porin 2
MTLPGLRSLSAPLLCGLVMHLVPDSTQAESQIAPGLFDRSLGNGIHQFTAHRQSIATAAWSDSPRASRALRVQSVQFTDGAGWNAAGTRISALYRENESVLATADTQLEVALVSARGRERLIGEASCAWRLTPSTRVELLAASDWVDTPRAFDDGLTSKYIGARIEQRLLPGLTATALAGYQPISDGYARTIAKSQLVYELVPRLGLALQAAYSAVESNGREVADRYFNPASLDEAIGGITFRHDIAGVQMEAGARYGLAVMEGAEYSGVRLSVGLAAPLALFADQLPPGSRFTLNGQYSDGHGVATPGLAGARRVSVGVELPL